MFFEEDHSRHSVLVAFKLLHGSCIETVTKAEYSCFLCGVYTHHSSPSLAKECTITVLSWLPDAISTTDGKKQEMKN